MSTDENTWRHLEETVFQINEQVRRFRCRDGYDLERKENNERIAYLGQTMFDKASRTFNWILVADPLLEAAASGSETSDAKSALLQVIKGLASSEMPTDWSWERFKERYSHKSNFNEYIDLIHKHVKTYKETGEVEDLDPRSLADVWTAIVMLYACYSHPKDHNFEGIFFRVLEEFGHSKPDKVKSAVFGIADFGDTTLDLRAWKTRLGIASSIEDCPNFDGVTTIEEEKNSFYYGQGRQKEAKILREVILNHIIMKWEFGEEKTLEQGIRSHPFVMLIPLYDVWNGLEGWGGLQAVVIVFLKPSESKNKGECVIHPEWEKEHHKTMLHRCGAFAGEITQAAIRRALARPIEPPYDLVRHFLRILIEVQDWEEAVVFYDETPNYLFARFTYTWEHGGKKYKGMRERWKEYKIEPCNTDPKNANDYRYFDADPSKDDAKKELQYLTGPLLQFESLREDDGKFYMWWTAKDEKDRQDLWAKAILPGLSDDERAMVSGTAIRFKFPKACRIPPEDKTAARKYLVESYRRQQLELMRGLIPKVRARRAALRNAVSAIMGRNMSHNIGSHVLARYAAEIGKTATKETAAELGEATTESRSETISRSEKIDPTADFLSYLQRRMDFLAEMGTSDKAFWTQPLLLGAQLDRLNLEHERERLRDEFTPLLTYITGKADLPANVEFDEFSPSTLFSCPGGEVGVHALYVILENVIRNSARHNPERHDRVDIRVCTESQQEFPGLIKLRITDTGSVIRGAEEGKKALPQNINDIMAKEILDPDGRPHPENWGIREMQICAQYLRQLQLSDLEDVPYAEEDMTAKAPLIKAEGEIGESLSYVIYLREAKPLAKIVRGEETKIGDMEDGVVLVTLSRALLALEGAPRSKDELLKERNVLCDIRNYIFVAYDGTDANLVEWIKEHAGDLPLRRLTHIPALNRHVNPKSLLEILYEALAKQIQKTQDSDGAREKQLPLTPPAGLVLAGNEAIADSNQSEDGNPLTVKNKTLRTAWGSWIDQKCWNGDWKHRECNKHRLDACIWLDHPSKADVHFYSKKSGPLINSVAVEPVFSDSPAAEAIRALKSGEGWELIAAALPNVVVLDERVQAAVDNKVRKGLTAGDCWAGMRVEVPATDQIKLDEPTFACCRTYLENLRKPADYVILHLTVLEKLNDGRRRTDTDATLPKTLKRLICGTPVKSAAIMIVTGRGVSTFDRFGDDLANQVRYLPVSALLEYLARRPSKLGLMRVLWSASRPWREPDAESNPDVSRP